MVKIVQGTLIISLARRNLVELSFHLCGEIQIEQIGEMRDQQAAHPQAAFGRLEFALFEHRVFPLNERLHRGAIRTGTANPLCLQRLHQRGFGVARWGFGGVFLWGHRQWGGGRFFA